MDCNTSKYTFTEYQAKSSTDRNKINLDKKLSPNRIESSKHRNEVKFITLEYENKIDCNNSENNKYFKCPVKSCDKVFPKECNLKDHVRTHTGEKPFKCTFINCEKKFTQQGNLKKHQNVHQGEKKFICEYFNCGKRFTASYNLKVSSNFI